MVDRDQELHGIFHFETRGYMNFVTLSKTVQAVQFWDQQTCYHHTPNTSKERTACCSCKMQISFENLWDMQNRCTAWLPLNNGQSAVHHLSTLLLLLHASKYSAVRYSEQCYNERKLQRIIFINQIRTLRRKWRNTIGRRSTRVRMTCRAFPLWLERRSSSLLSFVRFCYQFSSVICLFVQCIKLNKSILYYFYTYIFLFYITFFLFKWLCWMVTVL